MRLVMSKQDSMNGSLSARSIYEHRRQVALKRDSICEIDVKSDSIAGCAFDVFLRVFMNGLSRFTTFHYIRM